MTAPAKTTVALLPVEERAMQAIIAQGAPALVALQEEVNGYSELQTLTVTDKESDSAVHNGYMTLRGRRTEIQGMGKSAREDAVAYQKAVVSAEKQLIEIIKPVEDQLKTNRDAYREVQKSIREAAKARNSNIQSAIDFYKNYPSGYFNASSSELAAAIEELSANDDDHIKAHFAQWDNDKVQGQGVESAIEQRDLALTSLKQAHEKAVAAEAAQADLEAMRIQQEISNKVNAGLSGGLSEVDAAINEVAKFSESRDVTAQLTMLGQRKADLEQQAKVAAEQAEQSRKMQEAEQAKLKAEKDAADAKAKAAQEEADRLKQDEANRVAAEEKKQREIKEEEARKAEEAAEEARQEALRPDKEKLTLFLDQVEVFAANNAPELEDENAVALRDYVLDQVEKMTQAVKERAASL